MINDWFINFHFPRSWTFLLQEIADKYPAWLEENRAKLDETQLDRYTKQCALMKTVCTELEQETEADSTEVKKERTNKVLSLMQQVSQLLKIVSFLFIQKIFIYFF